MREKGLHRLAQIEHCQLGPGGGHEAAAGRRAVAARAVYHYRPARWNLAGTRPQLG